MVKNIIYSKQNHQSIRNPKIERLQSSKLENTTPNTTVSPKRKKLKITLHITILDI